MPQIKKVDQLKIGDEVKIQNRIYVVMETPHHSIVFERFVAKAQLKPSKSARKRKLINGWARKTRESRPELLLSDFTRSIDGKLASVVGFEIVSSANEYAG